MVINGDFVLELIIMMNFNVLNEWLSMCLLMVTDLHRDAERFEVLSPFVRESHHISNCVCFSSPYRSITGSLNVL